MQVEKALSEDSDGDNAAGQNRPHEQTALLDVINHGGNLLRPFLDAEQAGLRGGSAAPRAMLKQRGFAAIN
jgi:hypothetical protein